MALSNQRNSYLRMQMWNVFRDEGRDHVTPLTNLDREVRRVNVRKAKRVRDVVEGSASGIEFLQIGGGIAPPVLGEPIERVVSWEFSNPAQPGPATFADFEAIVGSVPFDGRLKLFQLFWSNPAADELGVAIRFSSSGSVFLASQDFGMAGTGNLDIRPDFINLFFVPPVGFAFNSDYKFPMSMPVVGGETITLVVRHTGAIPLNQLELRGVMTFQSGRTEIAAPIFTQPAIKVKITNQQQSVRKESVVDVPDEGPQIVKRKVTLFPTYACAPDILVGLSTNEWVIRPGKAQSLTGVKIEGGDDLPSAPSPPDPRCSFIGWEARIRGARVSPATPQITTERITRVIRTPPPPPPSPPEARIPLPGEGLMFVPATFSRGNLQGYLIPAPRRGQSVTMANGQWTRRPAFVGEEVTGLIQEVYANQSIPDGAVIGRPGSIQHSVATRAVSARAPFQSKAFLRG